MNAINGKRIALGGVVAALVLLVATIAAEPLAADIQSSWLDGLGVEPPEEAVFAAYFLMALLGGVVMVWLYAALTQRFGPGARTALIVGGVFWILNCFMPNTALVTYGLLTTPMYMFATLNDLVTVPLAALAGASVYQDARVIGLRRRVVTG